MIDAIVVVTHKQKYFLARLCIASIRYFYPDIEIFLIKDRLTGDFDSSELEQAMNVKVLELGIREFGWSAAKVHLLFSKELHGKKVLSLDEDIVFAGRLLEPLAQYSDDYDFVVDPDYIDDLEPVKGIYYNPDDIKGFDPDFKYPGYVFNGGQMVVTPGKITKEDISSFFDLDNYPFYKRRDLLPQVDQSLLNYFLPKQAQEGKIRLGAKVMMKWSELPEVAAMSLEKVKEGSHYLYLIHYAGVLRVSDISRMTRPDILKFFEEFYYQHVPNGKVKRALNTILAKIEYPIRKIYEEAIVKRKK